MSVERVHIGESSINPRRDRPEWNMNDETVERTEGDLFRDYIAGDRNALRTLFQRYETRIFVYCRRILGNREDAEDALQETFLRISRQNSFDGDRVSAWIYRIALNVCRTSFRRRTSRSARTLESMETEPGVQPPTPAQVYAERITEEEVSRALDELPDLQREAIVLKYLDHLTSPEVAEILEVPLTTVEGRLRQGREKLRRILARRRKI